MPPLEGAHETHRRARPRAQTSRALTDSVPTWDTQRAQSLPRAASARRASPQIGGFAASGGRDTRDPLVRSAPGIRPSATVNRSVQLARCVVVRPRGGPSLARRAVRSRVSDFKGRAPRLVLLISARGG